MIFELDDIFEAEGGKLWKVSGVVHDEGRLVNAAMNGREPKVSMMRLVNLKHRLAL